MTRRTDQPELPDTAALALAAPFELAAGDAEGTKPRRLAGVAYSGDVITDSGYAPRIVIDLASTKAPAKVPVLVDHDNPQRAGFAALKIGSQVETDGVLLATPIGRQIAQEADAGFPFQQSIRVYPGRIERIPAGQRVALNGRDFEGPLVVYRDNRIREVSLTPVGADHRTDARVFSRAHTPEETRMSDEQKTELDALNAKVTDLETKLAAANAQVTALTTERDRLAGDAKKAAEDARFDAVKNLYREIGQKEPKREEVAHYIGMSADAFDAVAKQLRAMKPTVPDALFSHTVGASGSGTVVEGDAPNLNDPLVFAAAITAEVTKARAQGRDLSHLEASRIVRARVAA